MRDIIDSEDINKLNVSAEIKERARQVLWNKGKKALAEFLGNVTNYSVEENSVIEVLKALYPNHNPAFYSQQLMHLRGIGVVSTYEGKKIACEYCQGSENIKTICNACLTHVENEAKEAESELISFREKAKK